MTRTKEDRLPVTFHHKTARVRNEAPEMGETSLTLSETSSLLTQQLDTAVPAIMVIDPAMVDVPKFAKRG